MMLPSITNQRVESSVLRRLVGKSLSPERQKTQQAVLDSMLDPCSVEGMAAMAIQEPHRSPCFAHLQKLRAELNNQPILPASTDSFPNTRVIAVKEMKPTEPQEKDKILCRKDNDGRPLKLLHWKAFGNPVQGLTKRHKCEGIPGKCEKCRRMIEIRQATERLMAKRAAKQLLQESKAGAKGTEKEETGFEENEQKIKREERFCKIVPPANRTPVQKSKSMPMVDMNFLPIGVKCKWVQPAVSEMPKAVLMAHPVDPTDIEDIRLHRNVSELKFQHEYMGDEPDFESEKIESWDLAPRSETNVVFIPPNWCESKYVPTRSLEPKIRIIDMSTGENDSFAHTSESRGLVPALRNLLPRKSQVTDVIDLKQYGNAEAWINKVNTSQQLDEKDRIN